MPYVATGDRGLTEPLPVDPSGEEEEIADEVCEDMGFRGGTGGSCMWEARALAHDHCENREFDEDEINGQFCVYGAIRRIPDNLHMKEQLVDSMCRNQFDDPKEIEVCRRMGYSGIDPSEVNTRIHRLNFEPERGIDDLLSEWDDPWEEPEEGLLTMRNLGIAGAVAGGGLLLVLLGQ